MDILTIIIEGCGGGINYKEYFKTQLPYQWLCVLDVGGGLPFKGLPNDIMLPHSEP